MSIEICDSIIKSFYDTNSGIMVCAYVVPDINCFRLTSHYKEYLPEIFDINSLSYCSTIQFCQFKKETLEDIKCLLETIKEGDEYVSSLKTYIEFNNADLEEEEEEEDKDEYYITIGHMEYYEQNEEPKLGDDIQNTYSFDVPTLEMLKEIVNFLDGQFN